MHLSALGQELLLLGYVIDQAAHHWEAVWHTKGTGTLGALTTMLKAHDRRVRLLGLHNSVPAAEPAAAETVQQATAQPPAENTQPVPESEPVPGAETAVPSQQLEKSTASPPAVQPPAHSPMATPALETPPETWPPAAEPLPPALPSTAYGPKPPPTPVAPLRMLPVDTAPLPPTNGPPTRQRDFRLPNPRVL